VKASVLAAFGLVLAPGLVAGQISLYGRAGIGRLEHRVRFAGRIEPSSGMVFSGALGIIVRERFEVWGEALGGHLGADSPDGEDRDVAQVQLLGGVHLRPWLTLQVGASALTYSTPLARQHWTALRLGAEAHVPLALDGVRGLVRGQWMPVVSVSGLEPPAVALAAGAGLEWRGKRISLSALYTLERYDFAGSDADTRRLEEVSSLQVRASVGLRTRSAAAARDPASQ